MVQTFESITKAAAKSKTKTSVAQLAAASRSLCKSTSGSVQIYARGFKKASQDFKDKDLSADNVGVLINSLIGMSGSGANAHPGVESNAQPGALIINNILGMLAGAR